VPTWQAWGPEFKPQYLQKAKQNNMNNPFHLMTCTGNELVMDLENPPKMDAHSPKHPEAWRTLQKTLLLFCFVFEGPFLKRTEALFSFRKKQIFFQFPGRAVPSGAGALAKCCHPVGRSETQQMTTWSIHPPLPRRLEHTKPSVAGRYWQWLRALPWVPRTVESRAGR
jgi:hypothetical protein